MADMSLISLAVVVGSTYQPAQHSQHLPATITETTTTATTCEFCLETIIPELLKGRLHLRYKKKVLHRPCSFQGSSFPVDLRAGEAET